jgi:hypothetical protein
VAKDGSASYDALVDIFECVETFLRHIKIYTETSSIPAMTDILIKVMVLALQLNKSTREDLASISRLVLAVGLTFRREIYEETT